MLDKWLRRCILDTSTTQRRSPCTITIKTTRLPLKNPNLRASSSPLLPLQSSPFGVSCWLWVSDTINQQSRVLKCLLSLTPVCPETSIAYMLRCGMRSSIGNIPLLSGRIVHFGPLSNGLKRNKRHKLGRLQ